MWVESEKNILSGYCEESNGKEMEIISGNRFGNCSIPIHNCLAVFHHPGSEIDKRISIPLTGFEVRVFWTYSFGSFFADGMGS